MKAIQEQNVRETDPKTPYAKPTLMKHKPLRDVTGQVLSGEA